MLAIDEKVKMSYASAEPREILQAPPSALLGVSEDAAAALKALEITSVFELATSQIFANAVDLVRSADPNGTVFAKYGAVPHDVLDDGALSTDLPNLPTAGIEHIKGIGASNAPALKNALAIKTIHDLAFWPPYVAAVSILNSAFNLQADEQYDPEAPADLLPTSGEYPTQRVYYTTVVLDEIKKNIEDLEELDHPVDITSVIGKDYGFDAPAIGAILTYVQSWYSQGVTLGSLLKSVALAPGESTRLAMVDWTQQLKTRASEDISELEDLSNVTEHTRSMNEVTSAVAKEAQGGRSGMSTTSDTSSSATTTSGGSTAFDPGLDFSLSGLFAPQPPKPKLTTSDTATTTTEGHAKTTVDGWSNSWGSRNLSAEMAQNIMDRTQQHATSSRSRYATAIQEVSQSESEKVSTRVVTNYNHMHALSVQYYEVVQLYRVTVQLNKVEKCLFIPMKVITFNPDDPRAAEYGQRRQEVEDIIGRYRSILYQAAPNRMVQEALIFSGDSLLLTPTLPQKQNEAVKALSNAQRQSGLLLATVAGDPWHLPPDTTLSEAEFTCSHDINEIVLRGSQDKVYTFDLETHTKHAIINPALPISEIASVELGVNERTIDEGAKEHMEGGPYDLSVVLSLHSRGFGFSYTLDTTIQQVSYSLYTSPGGADQKPIRTYKAPNVQIFTISVSDFPEMGLFKHLYSNRLYYNQQIWKNLPADDIALLLSPYKYSDDGMDEVPVMQLIDPTPVVTAGNYLGFRMQVPGHEGVRLPRPLSRSLLDKAVKTTLELTPEKQRKLREAGKYVRLEEAAPAENTAADKWNKWLEYHDIDLTHIEEDLVPLPSGGVFAEAVLGRFNAAEKLDITRFWNWQESPILITPPEISPVVAGNAPPLGEAYKPGQLSQPVVSITNPTSLPEPTGLSSVLSALTVSNMFRDMSTTSALAALAQQSQAASLSAAQTAAQQATLAATTEATTRADTAKALAALAASAIGAIMGVPIPAGTGGGSSTKSSPSTSGAMINQGAKMDKAKASANGTGGSTAPSTAPKTSGSTGGSGPGGSTPTNKSSEQKAFDYALAQDNPVGVASDTASDALSQIGMASGYDFLGPDEITPEGVAAQVEMIPYMGDAFANLSPQEIADWNRRLAKYQSDNFDNKGYSNPLSPELLLHWLDNALSSQPNDGDLVGAQAIDVDHIEKNPYVVDFLEREVLPVILGEKPTSKGEWRGVKKRIADRLASDPTWNGHDTWFIPYSARMVIPSRSIYFGDLNDQDLFYALHEFLLNTEVEVEVNRAGDPTSGRYDVKFNSWESWVHDVYDWAEKPGTTGAGDITPNPDRGNPFNAENPVMPDRLFVFVANATQRRVEDAGLAKPYVVESKRWAVSGDAFEGITIFV